jgi:prevent-host-death family protein
MAAFQVGVRELKNRTTEILRQVEVGDRVSVTRRGRVIAVIEPASEGVARPSDSLYQRLKRHIETRSPSVRSGSHAREFSRISTKIARSVAGRSWREVDRLAKGDRYGLSR